MDLNDVDLEACTAGDPGAWSAFVDRLSGVIVAAVRRTLHGRGARRDVDVDDAVQEVFVRLVRNEFRLLRSYDPDRAALSTWLTIVARSVTIDHLRRRRLATVPLADVDPAAPPPAGDDRIGPAPPLHLLSARQRLVLHLLFDEGMSVPEAARLLDVDDQTIRSTKHKALSRLREHLAPGAARRPDGEAPEGGEPVIDDTGGAVSGPGTDRSRREGGCPDPFSRRKGWRSP